MADREALFKDITAGETDPQTVAVYDQTTTPTNEATKAKLYAKDVGGVAKIHTLSSDGIEIEIGAAPSVTTLTSVASNVAVDANLGPLYELELTEATTELNNPSNLIEGNEFTVVIKQDATGSRTLTFGTEWLKKDGLTSGIATAASTVTILRGNAVNLPNGPGLRVYYTLDHEEESTGAPAAHASTHIQAGGDEIDGDQLDIDFTPANYTPDVTPAEVTSVDHLSAHLKGIDDALAGGGGGPFALDATVQTTDATVTVLDTVATTTNNATWINGTIVGRDNTANEAAFYKFSALFDNNSGTVTQKGSTTVLDTHEDDASWDFDLNISGTNIQIRVIGDATNAVEWRFLGNSGTHG